MIVCRSSCIRRHFLYQAQASGNNSAGQMGANPRHQTVAGSWIWRRVLFLLLAMPVCQARGYSQSGPQPPCGKEPVPPYPGLDDSAIAKSWNRSEFGRDWKPPACNRLGCGGLYNVGNHRRAISSNLGSRRLASPHRGHFRTRGHALLVDHSQAVENTNRGRLRSDRLAA